MGLIVVLAVVRQVTTNLFVKKRLMLCMVLLAGAAVLEIAWVGIPGFPASAIARPHENLRSLEAMLILLAMMVAAVVLLFNRFRQARISERYPAIVQDTVTFGLFVLAGTYLWPEKLFTTSAVGAVVIGFALQDTLGNLFSGLAIQVEKPFDVGDWIHVSGQEGRVQEVTWRATKIRTKAGNFVIIPNSLISKDKIINYSQPSKLLRLEFTINLDYAALPNRVKDLAMKTMLELPEVMREPRPDVLLVEFTGSDIAYLCRFWVEDFANTEPVLDKFSTLLFYHLQRAGIRVPFPVRDVRITEHAATPATPATPVEDARTRFVERSDIFHDLPAEDRALIARSLRPITFAMGEAIARQGMFGDSMYFIGTGTVDILLEGGGKTTRVTTLKDGGYFGEMSLLTGEPRTATVVASSDVQAYELSKEDFRGVLLRDSSLAEVMSRTVAERKTELDRLTSEIGVSEETIAAAEETLLRKIQKFFHLKP